MGSRAKLTQERSGIRRDEPPTATIELCDEGGALSTLRPSTP